MEIFKTHKKIFIFLGIFVGLLLIYFLFFAGRSSGVKKSTLGPTASGLVSEISISPADEGVGRELLAVLNELKSISLDASIFSNPVFNSLQDWSKPIEPQPFGKNLGRRNPFSDFGKGTATSSANSVSGSSR